MGVGRAAITRRLTKRSRPATIEFGLIVVDIGWGRQKNDFSGVDG